MSTSPAPVAPSERAFSVDVLRGFALCGILFMNIVSFGRYFAEYTNPVAAGPMSTADMFAWVVTYLFADMKFISIFSMLFGAGLVLLGDRISRTNDQQGFAGLYYRRIGWLFVFGMAHAWLLWYGDILVTYALCGLLLYPMRKLSPRVLIIIGACALVVPIVVFAGFGLLTQVQFEQLGVREALEAQARGEMLTPVQKSSIQQWSQSLEDWAPSAETLTGELAANTGSWLDAFFHRVKTNLFMQLFLFPIWGLWRCGGLMLVGMGLMKLGVFSAARSTNFYGMCIALGLGLGLPMCALGVWDMHQSGFTYARWMAFNSNLNYVGSVGVALAYVGIVMLLCRSTILGANSLAGRWLAAMGRMGFTNYLMQTLICTTIFYGYGLGYFAAWERWQLVFIMVPIVLFVQLIYSTLWLRMFRMGPAEWLWRSLTYWRLQPMQREIASVPRIG